MSKTFKHNVWQAVRSNREVTHPREKELVSELVDSDRPNLANGTKNINALNRYGNNRKMWAKEKIEQRKTERRNRKRFDFSDGDE